jgi:hypothetical protein
MLEFLVSFSHRLLSTQRITYWGEDRGEKIRGVAEGGENRIERQKVGRESERERGQETEGETDGRREAEKGKQTGKKGLV